MSYTKIENDRLILRSLKDLILLRNDHYVYRYEPTFLTELQGTPEEALKTIQELDIWKDRQCILGIFEKTILMFLSALQNSMILSHPAK